MNETIQKIFNQIKSIFGKLNKKQKIIAGGVLALFVIILLFAVSTSSQRSMVYLFKRPLTVSDYAKITKKLQEYGSKFTTKDDRFVLVRDEKLGATLRMRLGQDSLLPTGIKGWELFDTEKWTTTDFERNVMKRRAIIGAMIRHLRMLEDIEDVKLTVSMPESSLYISKTQPWKASVTIIKKPFSDIYKNKKKIKGIISLVANGIDRLLAENIVVTDNTGNIISDFSDDQKTDYLKRAKAENKITEELRIKMEYQLRKQLKQVLGDDRFDLTVRMELDFDQKMVSKDEIIPIVMLKDDPETPYYDGKVVLRSTTSMKTVKENFKGPTYIPEGPAGTQNNIPPGLKSKINRFSHYNKNEKIVNTKHSTQKTKVKKAPVVVKKISVSAWLDGTWKKLYDKDGNLRITQQGSILRKYTPVKAESIKKIEDIIKGAIAYDAGKGFQVVVKHLPFDRTKQFEIEDDEIRSKERIRKTLIAAVAALFILFMGTLMYRVISKEIARRKRIREEELALQQQRMREQALRAAEDEGVEVELSLEEKARMEMQENAINMARERPEDVAQVLRTWMVEE